MVGAPGFEPGRSDGALCSTGRRGQPYPPDTQTENFGGEPGNRTQSRASAWHFSNVLAYHLPRSPWHRDEDSNPMRLVWNQAALPGASRCEFWRRVGDSNSRALAVRQFSGLLGYRLPIPSAFRLLVGEERLELSNPKEAGF